MNQETQPFRLASTPFAINRNRPVVQVAGGQGAYGNIKAVLERIDLGPCRGKRVLLKPNAGRIAKPGSGICTNSTAVAAAIDGFVAAGAQVAVGESPITGVNTLEALEQTGIAQVARDRGIPLLDMDARPAVSVPIDGLAIKSLKLCPEVLEFDIIVSIATMKTHMHTGVTLGVKNMKGCLWRRSKVALHMLPPVAGRSEKPLDIAIADMSLALFPHLTLIDGSCGMEGIGPSAGTPICLDCAVAGVDPFATDAVACALMGKRAQDVPHLAMGAARGGGVIDLDRITVQGKNWRQYSRPFADPPTDISIGFPEFDIYDENSCSACQSSLLLFLKRYGDSILDYVPQGERFRFAIGKGNKDLPVGTICVGNCTRNQRQVGTFVKGCPPVGSEILRTLIGVPTLPGKDDPTSS